MTPINKHNMDGFIFMQRENIRNTYIYIYKKADTFQKQDNLRFVFIHKKLDTVRYAIFHEFV